MVMTVVPAAIHNWERCDMGTRRRILKEICICVLTASVLFVVVIGLMAYRDKKECLCSTLTYQEQSRQFDEQLERVVDIGTLNTGTFSVILTTCSHGKRMQLVVHVDEKVYKATLLN